MSEPEYDFTEYATALVADWPPLTERQKVRLNNIFNPHQCRAAPADLDVVQAEMEAREAHDNAKTVHRYVEGLLACEGCGRPPKAHNEDSTHTWTPTRDVLAQAKEKT